MVEVERTLCKNISLYPSHIENVKRYAKAKGYRGESEAYQDIIDDFFNKDDKQTKTDFILFIGVPFLFCMLTTIVNLSTEKVFNILIHQGIFADELYLLSRVFMVLSFGSIGILIACVYWYRKKYSEQKEHMEDIEDGD